MDFDRHEEQWDWYARDSAKNKIYSPIPKDRDQVFFTNQGLLPAVIRKKSALPQLQGFAKKAKNITTFNLAALNFDRFSLNELSKEDWSNTIDTFLNAMSDSVIETALDQQPPEIQKYSAKEIASVLKEKRLYFKADMMKYYTFLSRTVSMVGTNDPELFSISKMDHGIISVSVNKIDSAGNISRRLYERKFEPGDTKEIQIYGLEGNDQFIVTGNESKIKVRLIGGPGKDEFINKSKGRKVVVYDVNADQNVVSVGGIKNKISSNAQANTYVRLQTHHYNSISPGIGAEYASDGGIYVGPQLKLTTLGFRKNPYNMHQLLLVGRALNNVSYNIKYEGEFIKVFGNTNLEIGADSKLPTARTHFFGIGNTSVFEKTKGESYYLFHYNVTNISLLLRTPISSWLQVNYGPVFQFFKLNEKENEGKYISSIQITDSKELFSQRSSGGARLSFKIDTKNSQVIPTRGIESGIYGQSLVALNKVSNNTSQVGGHFSVYTDFISKKHVVLHRDLELATFLAIMKLNKPRISGLWRISGDHRITRFAGRTRAYNNTELRVNFGELNALLFRAPFGLLVFNDIGRVWADDEKSTYGIMGMAAAFGLPH